MEILLLIVAAVAFLVYIVGGWIFKVPKRYLQPAFLAGLLLVLAYLVKDLPPLVMVLCLVAAVVISARLMFFRAP